MAGNGDFDDWDLDLTPIRPPASSSGAGHAEPGANGAPLDIVGALSDLKRSVDRLAGRIGRIERALAVEGADDAEPTAAATRRLRTLGAKSADRPAAESQSD